jgi:large subunit ribosomal protein L6
MKVPNLTEKIEIPEGVQVSAEGKTVTVKGAKGELKRAFNFHKVVFAVEGSDVVISAKNATRREKMQAGTAKAHIKNMIKGVVDGHAYKLKICSGHFPMNVSLSGDTLSVKNFLGEKVPRTLKIKDGADVKVDGDFVTVEGSDIEIVGQVAADIEQLTRVTDKDIRIFQDGIYIIEKPKRALL